MKLLFLFFLLRVSPSQQVCAPDCTGVDSVAMVPDPTDFTKYYTCLDTDQSGNLSPSGDAVKCPTDEYFNAASLKCDPLLSADPGTLRTCDPCQVDCTGPLPVAPHPTNCSLYYECHPDGRTTQHRCSRDSFFNYHTGSCTEDWSQCYSYCDPEEPHCTRLNQTIPHPSDSSVFFLCTSEGPVRRQCPCHMAFQKDSNECKSYPSGGQNASWKCGANDNFLFFLVIFFFCLW
ncbi:uncharacterized protein [Penaeus vannamei]|uniref:uncharacterized protein n=1 Tax=Penaeus vannamei TaxID=6689 RepID=UPI00387F6EF2